MSVFVCLGIWGSHVRGEVSIKSCIEGEVYIDQKEMAYLQGEGAPKKRRDRRKHTSLCTFAKHIVLLSSRHIYNGKKFVCI